MPSFLFDFLSERWSPFPLTRFIDTFLPHAHGFKCRVCQGYLPYKDHKLIRKEDNDVIFAMVTKKLMNADLDWFRDKAVEEKISYYIEIQAGYSFPHSLYHSIDLGMFPQFHRVDPSQLTAAQQQYLQTSKRKLEKEPAKLVSLHKDGIITDFVDNLLYMVLFHSVIIRDVLTIVQYTCADFMCSYMQILQNKRSISTSNVESKLMKNLG